MLNQDIIISRKLDIVLKLSQYTEIKSYCIHSKDIALEFIKIQTRFHLRFAIKLSNLGIPSTCSSVKYLVQKDFAFKIEHQSLHLTLCFMNINNL